MKKVPFATDRRQFLSFSVALLASSSPLAAIAARTNGPSDQSSDAHANPALATDPMRPQFHLLPARNWMNDPNGPIYFNGNYHMFFQYNPLAATWGDMSWNHAISPDMVHWKHLPVAMTPTPDSPDAFGVFSGSAIAVPHGAGKRVYVVYTGTIKSDDAHATIRDGANNIQESQCLAWSDDPQLVHWTKDPQPIIPLPPPGMKITGFRDPSVWKQGESYYMTVGAGEAKVGGCVLLYTSKDLKQWQYLHKLTSGEWNGKPTPNPCDDGEMWECPELFPLGNAHVLIYSTLGKVFWQSGDLDPATMKFTAKKTGLLDFDAFYAPKTQLDAQGRRIIWGWIPERRSEDAMRTAGWSGMMSLPRLLNLDPDGTLRISTPQQVNTLRVGELSREPSTTGILKTLHHASGEVLCTGSRGHDFDLTFRNGATLLSQIAYSAAAHSLTADGHTIALQPGDDPQVHAYVDGSVIELILGERVGYTKRFYYSSTTAPNIAVVANGRQPLILKAWKLAPISNNRLTTPA
jgi:beta-fructofuranosidase